MVTPGKFLLAFLAFIAMMAVIAAMTLFPETGHFASIAH